VQAGSHLWVIKEVFSNADGTIQFIEMKECCGANNEIFLQGKWVRAVVAAHQFNFPANLPPGSTANKYLLLATAGFAALPGAPAPDYIIEDNFFNIADDRLLYWHSYPSATFDFAPGAVPTDGIHSLVCLANNGQGCTTFEVQVNSPTNFAGESGSVIVACDPADLDLNGAVDVQDLVALLLAWGANPGHPADLDGSGTVGVDDLVALVLAWGPCA
jgi:hypothetical protein